MSDRVGGTTGRRLIDEPWVQVLLAKENFTAREAGLLARRQDYDAMGALRSAKDLRLVSLGLLGDGTRAKRYRLRVKEVEESMEDRSFVDYVNAQKEWSERTFGPGTREKGVIDHIHKELEEIGSAASAEKLSEWIDVIILAMDGAWRSGATPQQIAEALSAKQARNSARVWPDWRTMSEDQAIEHDRSVIPTEARYRCGRCASQQDWPGPCENCKIQQVVPNPAYGEERRHCSLCGGLLVIQSYSGAWVHYSTGQQHCP